MSLMYHRHLIPKALLIFNINIICHEKDSEYILQSALNRLEF